MVIKCKVPLQIDKVTSERSAISHDLPISILHRSITAIKRSCSDFFIDIVSSLSFGQSCAPNDDLISMLLDIVFTEEEEESDEDEKKCGTRDFSPYNVELQKTDKSPIIRSFLLQLLLEHK